MFTNTYETLQSKHLSRQSASVGKVCDGVGGVWWLGWEGVESELSIRLSLGQLKQNDGPSLLFV